MSATKKNKTAFSLAIIGIMFFSIGFALGMNGLIAPFLREALHISSAMSYLVITAAFLPFVVFSYPSGLIIKKIGYKKSMALSFVFFAIGFILFIPSANHSSFVLFLIATFIGGIGNTLLQASVNPYITIMGPIESAAKRMSIMGISNKAAWAIAPIFLALFLDISNAQIADMKQPFYIIIGVFIILGIVAMLSPLPEVLAEGENEAENEDNIPTQKETSIFQFPHLILGAVTLFLYVGVETLAMASIVDYADTLGLPNPASFTSYTVIGMVIGYCIGMFFIPKYLSQNVAMKACAIFGVTMSIVIVILPVNLSIWAVAALGLANSLMWPALWPLAMAKLGKFTKTGASILAMAIVGGAIIPLIFGFLKDIVPSMQQAYWICLPCYLFILYYAYLGYKLRTSKA